MEYLLAFLVGGAICAIVQVVMDSTKLQPGNIMVGIVCLGAVLGAVGIYEPFKEWAGAGASVPLLGFGNTLFQGVKEDINTNGFMGVFTGGLTNAAAGITGALIFGYIASVIFKPKL
ncbi:MAG: stage V sporulation protein AE [Lachnospiraceae bacterium]|nr:stage V sporulation protein AE [Lachnospiraceae bacterium]